MLGTVTVGSLIGASVLNLFTVLPNHHCMIALVGCTGVLALLGWYYLPALRSLCVALLAALVGFSWAYFQAQQKLAWHFPLSDLNRVVNVKGKVVGITQHYLHALRFDMELEEYEGKKLSLSVPVKIRLYWSQPTHTLLAGDKLQGLVKLKPASRLANPGEIDQEKQFFIENIRATGKWLTLLNHQPVKSSLLQLRQRLHEQMDDLLPNKPLLGVIQATTVGIYKNITPSQWQIFQATGLTHAVAISGLHISLVAMLFGGLVYLIVSQSSKLITLYPAKCYAAIGGTLAAVAYCAIAGFSIPTQRSLTMIVVVSVALLRRQVVMSWHTLALAWLIIGLFDPLAPLQIGFWLSFGCVATLIYGHSHSSDNRWRHELMPQLVVFIGLIPMSVFCFQQVPLLSPLANLIALPVINFLVVPPGLVGLLLLDICPPLASLCLHLAHGALASIWGILEEIAHTSYSIWYQGEVPLCELLLAAMGALILLAPRGLPARHLGWIAFLPLIFYRPPLLEQGECRFTLLDVGQGLAAVIQTRHHALLYDAGPLYGQLDAGQRIIKPFLRHQHIKQLDKVIISHGDLDHRGGLIGLQDWPIKEILSSEPEKLTLSAHPCLAGQRWQWDGVEFMMLNPSSVSKKRNDRSCVLKITSPHHSILLTGDIEKQAEKNLIEKFGAQLKSDILVVPHHGSLTSSTVEFIEKVAPDYALYPAGLGNHYGFPKPEIIARYQMQGSENLVSYQTGALTFTLRQKQLAPPVLWRESARRYWHQHFPPQQGRS